MEIFGKKADQILRTGRVLEDIGVRNWALTKQEALNAIDQFADNKIAVLGGDVYLSDGSTIRPSYDNWYCNREAGEPVDVFVSRSLAHARRYVSTYGSNSASENERRFALVPEAYEDS